MFLCLSLGKVYKLSQKVIVNLSKARLSNHFFLIYLCKLRPSNNANSNLIALDKFTELVEKNLDSAFIGEIRSWPNTTKQGLAQRIMRSLGLQRSLRSLSHHTPFSPEKASRHDTNHLG